MLHRSIVPALHPGDVEIFESIINQLIPIKSARIHRFQTQNASLVHSLRTVAKDAGLQPTLKCLSECKLLNEALCVSSGAIIMGPPASGKTSVRKILREALLSLEGEGKYASIEAIDIWPKVSCQNYF